jgi:protease I
MFSVDATFDSVNPTDYDGLVIPGGVINPDMMRMDQGAVKFVQGSSTASYPSPRSATGPGCW